MMPPEETPFPPTEEIDLNQGAPQSCRWVASTQSVKLPLFDFGGAGLPLLVVHATGFHAMVYRPIIDVLRAAGWRVYAVDLRGHGDAVFAHGSKLHWQRFTEDVLAVLGVLDELHPGAALYGFGHSKGGAALLRAEQARPGSFAGLFVYEPVILPADLPQAPPSAKNPMAEGARRRRFQFASRAEAIANYASKPPYDAFDRAALAWYVEHGFRDAASGGIELKCRPEWEAEIYEMSREEAPFRRLREVSCPVTVARGALVQPGPGAWAPRIAEQLKDARLLEFDGLGHLGPMQDPAAVAQGILSSLGKAAE